MYKRFLYLIPALLINIILASITVIRILCFDMFVSTWIMTGIMAGDFKRNSALDEEQIFIEEDGDDID